MLIYLQTKTMPQEESMTTTEQILLKPNELIGAIDKVRVGRKAKHLLNYFLQLAQFELIAKHHESCTFEFDIKTVNKLAEIDDKNLLRLKEELTPLMQPVVLRDDPKGFTMLVPITLIQVDIVENIYRIELQPIIVQLLKNCDYFTKLNLIELNPLTSKHSLVIFEWLKRYEPMGKIPLISVDELKEITNTQDKAGYKIFGNWQKKVLDTAVNEINKETNYTVAYTIQWARTKGHPKVSHIQFAFSRIKSPAEQQEQTQPEVQQKPKDLNQSEFEEIMAARLDIDDKYQSLCDKFLTGKFCRTAEEFYKATYTFPISRLERFYTAKIEKYPEHVDKLRWLWADYERDQRLPEDDTRRRINPRPQYQYEMYYRIRDLVERTPLIAEQFKQAEHRLGFASVLYRMRQYIGETAPLKLENYL